VEYARSLAPHIDPAVPVYALAADGPLRTVEGMATRLVRMARAVQPTGPYRIAGWAFGGLLAYEAASQLIGQDQEVEFIGMVETSFLPGSVNPATLDQTAPGARGGPGPPSGLAANGGDGGCTRGSDEARASSSYFPHPIPATVRIFATEGGARPVLPQPVTTLAVAVPGGVEALGAAISRELASVASSRAPAAAVDSASHVVLQRGLPGSPPLFCIPGAGANVLSFLELAAFLERRVPAYAIQPRGLDGSAVPHATVEAAAEAYLRTLHQLHPSGPVHLFGHSFGGWVVFEMAQRLRAAGRVVLSITMLDSEVPTGAAAEIVEYDSWQAFRLFVEVLEQAHECSLGISPEEADRLDEYARLRLLHQRLVQLRIFPARSDSAVLRGPFRAFSACLRTSYVPPGVFSGPARLILAEAVPDAAGAEAMSFAEIAAGWKQWAPALVASVAPGNHMTVLKQPHVAAVAEFLNGARSPGGA
jgi:thioesterase domain-containing protein